MATLYWTSTSSTDPTVAGNWSTGSAPTTGDDVVIQGIPGSSLANIQAADQHLVVLNSLTISQTYTGTIGNAGAGTAYWQIAATTWTIGVPANDGTNPGGSGRIKLDFGSNQFTGTILQTSNSTSDTGSPPVQLKGTNSSNKLYVLSGKVGVATVTPGETSTISDLEVVGSQAQVVCGSGVTLTTVNVASGATLTTNTAITTLGIGSGSKAMAYGSAALTTVNNSGTLYLNIRNGGSVATTINNYTGATLDCSGAPAVLTVGTLNSYANSYVKVNAANPSHLTVTTSNLKNLGTINYQS